MPSGWTTSPGFQAGPLVHPARVRDTKDPCPVHDGDRWHLFGSAGSVLDEVWRIFHATAPTASGPWTEQPNPELVGLHSDRIAAPGVVRSEGRLEMFVQTDFLSLGGTIEHLVSEDGGATFVRSETALAATPDGPEAGLFDAHPAIVGGVKYLTYAAMAQDLSGLRWNPGEYARSVRGPDVYLARSESGTWDGPWRRLGCILRQEDVPFHCPPGRDDYEWGLEGPQILELGPGRLLLNAVCFLPDRRRGRRQRVFFAVGRDVGGPYTTVAMPIDTPEAGWESGENGHAVALVTDRRLLLFYQARSAEVTEQDRGDARWRYGLRAWDLARLEDALF